MLANDVVLTTGHCVHHGPYESTQNSVLFAYPDGGPTSASDKVYWFGGTIAAPDPDLALLHLASPLPATSSPPWQASLDSTSSGDLVGATLTGYAWSSAGSAAEPWWNRVTAIAEQSADGLTPSSGPLAPAAIDGAPYFRAASPSGASLVGIAIAPAGSSSAAALVTTGDRSKWISAVRDMDWDPMASAQRLTSKWDEVATSYWAFSDVGAVGWAQAMRVATSLSYARGFPGGYFVGSEEAQGLDLECEGPGTIFIDATTDQLATTPEPFADVDAVGWDQAARDAMLVCQSAGYAGGHFDGNELHDGGQSKFGLICANASASFEWAAAGDLAPAGQAVVTSLSWSAAGKAADGYCRVRGYVSGFPTGQEDAGAYGAMCER